MFIQALYHLLLCPSVYEAEGINIAIKVVSEANQDELTQRLIDYLIGDIDSSPKVICKVCYIHLGAVSVSIIMDPVCNHTLAV